MTPLATKAALSRCRAPFGTAGAVAVSVALALASATAGLPAEDTGGAHDSGVFPWRQAGIDQRTAAAHLLDRFAFGPRPGAVDAVVQVGLEAWLEEQLAGASTASLDERLAKIAPSFRYTAEEILERYRSPASIRKLMEAEGIALPTTEQALDQAIAAYAHEHRLRLVERLVHELGSHKLLRAVYAEAQLHEVLTDFWFNHFNVSLRDHEIRRLIGVYERDAIRPFVTGRFRDMLGATARHPAMLLYLDNAHSFAEPGMPTRFNLDAYRWRRKLRNEQRQGKPPERRTFDADAAFYARGDDDTRPRGLNENYARELLELHTLGVDGGYTEADIAEVARAFTGWSVVPGKGATGEVSGAELEHLLQLPRAGFSRDGLFFFRADAHDIGEKTVLGHALPAERGMEDGHAVLDLLARHPSTSRSIARKLAIRFVSDSPPEALVDDLAATFLRTDGDLAAMVRTLARSPHFWSEDARRSKIKLPFELAASALRATDAEIERTGPLLRRIAQLGQRLYAHAAPAGYPEQATAWVNTGSLLGRMNLGLDIAASQIRGIRVDARRLAGEREPASLEAALEALAEILLPGRDVTGTVARLRPLAADPTLPARIADEARAALSGRAVPAPVLDGRDFEPPPTGPPREAIAYVVGLILGSPEFQRR